MPWIIFKTESGKIDRIFNGPVEIATLQSGQDESILAGTENDAIEYVYDGNIIARPTQSTTIDKNTLLANGIDVITISNAPANATFTATNQATGEAVSGSISGTDTFTTTIAGKISFKIECWPYLDWTATVEAI